MINKMKHGKIVKNISKRLKHFTKSLDDIVENEEEYFTNSCGMGEVDNYCIHKDLAIAVEVKSTNHDKARYKANYQLEKDAIYLRDTYKIKHFVGFYAYSDHNQKRGYNVKKVMQYDF